MDPKCESPMDAKCFWGAEKDQEALHQLGIYPKHLADLQKVYGGDQGAAWTRRTKT